MGEIGTEYLMQLLERTLARTPNKLQYCKAGPLEVEQDSVEPLACGSLLV